MNNFVKISISFVAGAIIGAFGMKKYIEYKRNEECFEYDEVDDEYPETTDEDYEAINEKRDDEVRKINYNRVNDISSIKSTKDDNYVRILNDLKYRNDLENAEYSQEDTISPITTNGSNPYEITHEEFEAIDSYESDEYTLYEDGYVTDSYGTPVSDEDIANTLGSNFKRGFDEGADQIWIRNDRLQMDFSVIRDLDKFIDVASPRIKRMVGLQ